MLLNLPINNSLKTTIIFADKEKNERDIFDMAGSGFESTVRLAKSSPAMWTPISEQNKENIVEALDEYIGNLKQFKKLEEDNKSLKVTISNSDILTKEFSDKQNASKRLLEEVESIAGVQYKIYSALVGTLFAIVASLDFFSIELCTYGVYRIRVKTVTICL